MMGQFSKCYSYLTIDQVVTILSGQTENKPEEIISTLFGEGILSALDFYYYSVPNQLVGDSFEEWSLMDQGLIRLGIDSYTQGHIPGNQARDYVIRAANGGLKVAWATAVDNKYLRNVSSTKTGKVEQSYNGAPVPFNQFRCKRSQLQQLLKGSGYDAPNSWFYITSAKKPAASKTTQGKQKKRAYAARDCLSKLMYEIVRQLNKQHGKLPTKFEVLGAIEKRGDGGLIYKNKGTGKERIQYIDQKSYEKVIVTTKAFYKRLNNIHHHFK